MNDIVYLKKVDNYEEILNIKYKSIPRIFKKGIYKYKNIFNIIIKREVQDNNLWILPLKDNFSLNKTEKLLKEMSKYNNNIYVLSNYLKNTQLYKLIDKYNISYINGYGLKRYLVIKILEYINIIQNEDISSMEVTLLTKDISEFNIFFIEEFAKLVKSIKVVTPNIYKFKKIDDKLYNKYGIAIQLSNSYKKSLSKSKIIINLDYNTIDINEYEIFDKSIIINCWKDDIKIKSKLFNGIVINSCNIKFKKEIGDNFRKMQIYDKYDSLALYESIISKEKEYSKILKRLDEDKVIVTSLIGKNGNINKCEFKNIFKKLDK